jgi:nucleotide-binding universal stress UspA family protein
MNVLEAANGAWEGVPISILVPQGEPGAVLTALAAGNDVLVVGDSGGDAVRHVVHGSVRAYCQRHAHCQVIGVRGDKEARDAR